MYALRWCGALVLEREETECQGGCTAQFDIFGFAAQSRHESRPRVWEVRKGPCEKALL